MTATSVCCIHLIEVSDNELISLSDKSYEKIKLSMKDWLVLDGKEKEIAQCLLDSQKFNDDSVYTNTDISLAFHRKCYMRFTDKTKIERAKKRVKEVSDSPSNDSKVIIRPKRKLLKDPTGIFPPTCVICTKDKFVFDKQTSIRKKEKLSVCQTFNASEALLDSAIKKNDETLIHKIQGIDCIAKEVKYHKSCYKSYTKKRLVQNDPNPPCSESYSVFCNVVNDRIIKNSEILSMDKLCAIFCTTLKNKNPDETYNVCNRQLKRWLQRDFPQVVFVKPKQKNLSELVLCSRASQEPILIENNFLSTEADTSENEEENTDLIIKTQPDYDCEMKGLLYKAALIVNNLLKSSPILDCNWPPTAEDLNMVNTEKLIPTLLFNFLAWCFGESDEIETDVFVTTSEKMKRKIFSIIQDMIHILSAGRKQTPKHLSLAMAVRHITGSARLINILNGLGHCISHSAVLEYDTQLAEMQLNSANSLPVGIVPNKFSTIVWDNIDFREETLTGHGTTHSTNGILIQQKVPTDLADNVYIKSIKKSKKRKLDPPTTLIPRYFLGQRHNPDIPEIITCDNRKAKLSEAKVIDHLYIVTKFGGDELLPGWTGFNCMLEKDNIPPLTTIQYLPVLEANPTDFSTVNAILTKSLDICKKLGLKEIVLVFDQAIYSKAQQIRWKEEKYKKPLVIRLGEFHVSMSFLAIIGKRFKDAGLYNILIESGIVAEGSVAGVLSGKCYNRSIRCHKIMFEAFSRLLWAEYLNSVSSKKRSHYFEISSHLHNNYAQGILKKNELPEEFLSIFESFKGFVESNCEVNVTFAFWVSYLDMVGSLLRFLRGTRNADWDLHLAVVEEIIPWFFSYDHVNYARYLPAYLFEMLNLPLTHPDIYSELKSGNFVAQRQNSYGFCGIAMDQAIEQTANRDSKTKGGLKGFTRNPAAVHRWMLSHHLRAHISLACEQLSGKTAEEYVKKDTYPAEIQKLEEMVNDVVNTITSMINPFTWREDVLVNISSGTFASDQVQLDLIKAKDVGKMAYDTYCKERLLEGHSIDIYSPIKQQKLLTFSSCGNKAASKNQMHQETYKKSTDLLARLIVMGQTSTLDMKKILEFNLNLFPPAIANFDGSLVKNNKSTLINGILGLADNDISITNLPIDSSTIIFDGMAVVQQLNNTPATFGDLAFNILEYVINVSKKYKCQTAHFVTDTYPNISIKNDERHRRKNGCETVMSINSPSQKIPKQFKKFLANGQNKEALINFIYEQWISYDSANLKGMAIYISHGRDCHLILPGNESAIANKINELTNDHEEADTKILLHALYASKSSKTVLIRSVDTDVFILSLAMSHNFPGDIYMIMGTTHSIKLKNISQIAKELGEEFCSALIGLHVFTGCDTCSAFKGKGKIKPLKAMLSNLSYIKMFVNLGSSWELSTTLLRNLEAFVCDLYGYPNVDKINDVRSKIFTLKFRIDVALPPNNDSLLMHTKRANFQCNIYRRCLECFINTPRPSEHGWLVTDNTIKIQWGNLPIAPDYLLKHISCSCLKTACSTKKCTCKSNNAFCSEFCSCESNCQNSNDSDIMDKEEQALVDNDILYDDNDDFNDNNSDYSE